MPNIHMSIKVEEKEKKSVCWLHLDSKQFYVTIATNLHI